MCCRLLYLISKLIVYCIHRYENIIMLFLFVCWNNKYLFILFIHLSKTYQFFLYFHSGTFFHLLMYSLLTLYWTPLIPKQNVPSFHLLPSSVQPFSVLSSSVLYCTSFPCKTYQLFLYFHPRYNLPPSPVRSSSVLCNFFTWKTFYFLLYFLPLYCACIVYPLPSAQSSTFSCTSFLCTVYVNCTGPTLPMLSLPPFSVLPPRVQPFLHTLLFYQ